jgi:hypothetical protein
MTLATCDSGGIRDNGRWEDLSLDTSGLECGSLADWAAPLDPFVCAHVCGVIGQEVHGPLSRHQGTW